ncbi:MAG: M20/M25/M40 family metallo-hydrolase [Ignavibacteria bacterium]
MIDFLLDIMSFNSTSGNEAELARHIFEKYKPAGAVPEIQEAGSGRLNVFFKWGEPKIIFCSHLDTVPPYIPPSKDNDVVYGRGSCDAKGQLAYMFEACKELSAEGYKDIAMLMVSGEEDGSHGAKAADPGLKDCKFMFIGEPTENKLISASKGNISINFTFKGKSCHSGYPHLGDNAIDRMSAFIKKLDAVDFGDDKVLGKTIYNIGMLESKNAHNVVPDLVTMKVFLRTTFVSHDKIVEHLKKLIDDQTEMKINYEHVPMNFFTVDGFETGIVSYGTDAPAFTSVKNKLLYGPGSIIDAHTSHEFIKIKDLYKAVSDVKEIYKKILNKS